MKKPRIPFAVLEGSVELVGFERCIGNKAFYNEASGWKCCGWQGRSPSMEN